MLDKRELLYFSLAGLHLLKKTGKAAVVSDLLGLQAQFANNPKVALRIRACDFAEKDWAEGLNAKKSATEKAAASLRIFIVGPS